MNIQINCKEDVKEDDLRFIYHNLQNFIKKYEETKNDFSHYKWKGCNKRWALKPEGNSMMKPKMMIYCNGKTMYFKVGD